MATSSGQFVPPADDPRRRAEALARWEGEGGALGASTQRSDVLDEMELRILARIGAAALSEWGALPPELKEGILRGVCTPPAAGQGARLKTRIAEFMRDHADR